MMGRPRHATAVDLHRAASNVPMNQPMAHPSIAIRVRLLMRRPRTTPDLETPIASALPISPNTAAFDAHHLP